jgi:hypothetical protein
MRQGGQPILAENQLSKGVLGLAGMLVLPALLGLSACAHDICKSKELPREQLCNCQPKDNQLLDRLQPTDLPYPVRKVVLRCANDVRATHRVVTKQTLRECTGADASLDQATRDSLGSLIDRSNLMDQKQLDDWNAQCMANSTDTVTISPNGAPTGSPASAPASAPAGTPAGPPAGAAPAASPPGHPPTPTGAAPAPAAPPPK